MPGAEQWESYFDPAGILEPLVYALDM